MDYNLEALGADRFQKLSQAILAATFPHVQCLPVGQPDGGRDAFINKDGRFLVYQVKFSKYPSNKNERIVIEDLIESEKDKVSKLIEHGASSYYLLTNVLGTSHLDVGSIDRVNNALTNAFGIPAFCWWRDDIERRIEGIHGLIWRYPEIIRTTDFLEKLSTDDPSRLEAIYSVYRLYVAAQFDREKEVKFQQVQIQNNLTDLFTDIPIGSARDRQPPPDTLGFGPADVRVVEAFFDERRYGYEEGGANPVLAAKWLFRCAPSQKLQRIVLEGAPGQGKSTVTQFISQYYRSKVINRDFCSDLDHGAPEVAARLPIRVDLRDYASWLAGFDPFAVHKNHARPASSNDSLESYISYQIHNISGGREFDIERLATLLAGSHCLLVLDGFDEVADIPTRNRLIEQIRQACSRLEDVVQSAQIVVTSRPSAFILSTGFPEREWAHWSLQPMRVEQISEYADKWMLAKSFGHRESVDFKELLLDRISRPHIRSLAQNPMQLAILLNLISTKGRSLPDKRTALYDSYIDLFFGREAEKDEVVRENREILIQIHQYIAWLLQTDAEKPGGAGSITEASLRETVANFLIAKGHDADVMKLFQGAVERVGALVSRVQGMLEFEVQPLREYFAGLFLYQTAPYSTLTAERGGSRPERFKALARRPYWSNVARFYAGCYNSGELASLLACLEEIHEEAAFKYTGHALQLAISLLADWVFSQEPRVVQMVVEFLSRNQNLRVLSASRSSWEDSRLNLPARCGRTELGNAALNAALTSEDPDYVRRVALIARMNLPGEILYRAWKLAMHEGALALERALSLNVFEAASSDDREKMIEQFGERFVSILVQRGGWSELNQSQLEIALRSVAHHLPDREWATVRMGRANGNVAFQRMYLMLIPSTYRVLSIYPETSTSLLTIMMNYGHAREPLVGEEDDDLPTSAYADFSAATRRGVLATVKDWRETLDPWNDVIESARRTWGASAPIVTLAMMAAGIRSRTVRAAHYNNLFDTKAPLAERVRHARLQSSIRWWVNMYDSIAGQGDKFLWCAVAMAWAPPTVLSSISELIDEIILEYSPMEFENISDAVSCAVSFNPGSSGGISSAKSSGLIFNRSERFAVIIANRFSQGAFTQVMRDIVKTYSGSDNVIIQTIGRFAKQYATRDPKFWDDVINLFERIKTKIDDGEFLGPYYYPRTGPMPVTYAERVMSRLDNFPLSILESAEAALVRKASGSRRTMSEVARDGGWFS